MNIKATVIPSFLLWFLTSHLPAFSFELKKYNWYDFYGKIGQYKISLALYSSADGELQGRYCYARFDNVIPLKGSITGNKLKFMEYAGGRLTGIFELQIMSDTTDRLEGFWTDSAGNRRLDCSLVLSAVNYGSGDKRYMDAPGNDSDAEGFVKRAKKAILKKDAAWLSANIRFPVQVRLDGKESFIVKSKRQFIDNVDRILYPAFQDQIKELCACNLFSNYRGIMLGRGELWINTKKQNGTPKPIFEITALNN